MAAQHGKAHTENDGKRVRDEYGALTPLFHRLTTLTDDDPKRAGLRDQLITGYLPLARHIAQRYSGKGIAKEDLLQVASVGLIHAVDRFDPARGSDFLSFAVPTMMGEVRRHFRDTTWPMRVPRRLQELRLAINQAGADLTQELGRPVTNADLARRLDVTEAEIEKGMEARQAFRSVSLDEPAFQDSGTGALSDTIGEDDLALELVVDHEALVPLLQDLPAREQRILALRFYGEKTQAQIGEEVGISQMHVSRLLKGTLDDLREHLLTAPR
ncbi:SigB/SigF/SigG family RNA polymerase sigma factor [Glycomyces harbinensis]|uniref:RNA polymerase sigma-B factor n=1 Tax=Glycomyces harbinensis TaxID=58114 RepID=A0A1G6YQI4_9ACTN|nr:SigB/SigF/SigG family RNA polymerase sigma factor [Glycomyces harbinensis]SDD92293.1 RNA polymerase sigma-B factor [Glycomyces harbinensis]